MKINFYNESIKGIYPKDKKVWRKWLNAIAKEEGFNIDALSYVFCNQEYLLQINQQYLNHDTHTDIITFDLSDEPSAIDGEIYISIPMVEENALSFKIDFENELARVVAHGLLHLCGYKDKKKEESVMMRQKEQYYMEKLAQL